MSITAIIENHGRRRRPLKRLVMARIGDEMYGKMKGHHCWWLTRDGKELANFDNEEEVDRIINMEAGRRDVATCLENAIVSAKSAYIAGVAESPEKGMEWLYNYLWGPGLLPTDEELAAGAQAFFNENHKGYYRHNGLRVSGGRVHRPLEPMVMAAAKEVEMSACGKHFVMIYSQDGKMVMPMVDSNGEVALYITESDARAIARKHALCQAFGYEIHCMGNGEE